VGELFPRIVYKTGVVKKITTPLIFVVRDGIRGHEPKWWHETIWRKK